MLRQAPSASHRLQRVVSPQTTHLPVNWEGGPTPESKTAPDCPSQPPRGPWQSKGPANTNPGEMSGPGWQQTGNRFLTRAGKRLSPPYQGNKKKNTEKVENGRKKYQGDTSLHLQVQTCQRYILGIQPTEDIKIAIFSFLNPWESTGTSPAKLKDGAPLQAARCGPSPGSTAAPPTSFHSLTQKIL